MMSVATNVSMHAIHEIKRITRMTIRETVKIGSPFRARGRFYTYVDRRWKTQSSA